MTSTLDKTVGSATNVAVVTPSRSHRRHVRKPGLSILAQGEPTLWLCGGALAVCLLMIVGLVALVLWFGLGTFWPGPLIQVRLRDNTALLGEVTRSERYRLSPQAIDNLNPEIANELRKRADNTGHVRCRRRLLRTGNYDLTNTHFQWVSDFEEMPNGETRPNWAVLLERVSWGRFYGKPFRFVLDQPRDVPIAEQQLQQIIQFFQVNRFRLNEVQQQQLDQELTVIQQQLGELRGTHVARFLAAQPMDKEHRVVAVVDDGQAMELNDVVASEHNVTSVRKVWEGMEPAWTQLQLHHSTVRQRDWQRIELEKHDLGHVNQLLEAARLGVRQAELDYGVPILPAARDLQRLVDSISALELAKKDALNIVQRVHESFGDSPLARLSETIIAQVTVEIDQQIDAPNASIKEIWYEVDQLPPVVRTTIDEFLSANKSVNKDASMIQEQINAIKDKNARYQLTMTTSSGQTKVLPVANIVRAIPANQLSTIDRFKVYVSRWYEFLADEPREANSEGGVMPAIWGTVAMTLIMSLIVVPFGVLAALYLREYARAGAIVSAVRISINNLAGVPSIVFGVFGLGFFCYIIGGFIDSGAKVQLPPFRWWVLVVALMFTAIAAFSVSLKTLTNVGRSASTRGRILSIVAAALWLFTTLAFVAVVAMTPYFSGFFAASLPNPTYGKAGLLWASLTLALLTLPVVIVATEEALSAVPNSLREGSYSCGGSKWQTIRRIVLPHAMPGIMTGMILAMARGAGEVAPLMLVGAVKMAPDLPVDGQFPYVHPERTFMHLGFHIYDLGFQSQNSEAAKPMVFTTTLLLIVIIAAMNILAIMLRTRLKRRFKGAEF